MMNSEKISRKRAIEISTQTLIEAEKERNQCDVFNACGEMNLDDAWGLVGEACYAYENTKVRHALMLIRADVAEKNIFCVEHKECKHIPHSIVWEQL